MKLMGIINLDHELDQLNELTYFRAGAAVPFAGRYRLIDFALSNMMNAEVQDIALFVRRKYRSLLDHIGEGRPWDLDRKRGGLFILPPDWNDPTDISAGDLQHMHNNRDFFDRSTSDYVVHSGSHQVSKVDFCDLAEYHKQKGADVTVVYKKIDVLQPEHEPCFRVDIGEDGFVTGIHNEKDHHNVYLELFIMEKNLFMQQMEYCIAHGDSYFFRDAILRNPNGLKIAAYEYTGYHAVINSVESYYKNSLDLLDQEKYEQLFSKDMPIQTKIKYEAPTKYLEGADVKNSLVANGCRIAGEVDGSVLFRGVQVEKGAKVINSIIMQKCVIKAGAIVENVIMDKDVQLTENRNLVGDSRKPFVIAKRSII
ncbi:glucose-1-phosphate adenylyltransferase subunit GlgD [Saccharibacillus sp. CPCC 101409]|uniref:glucose-1-phosphate adenylyltransferase subunit GlgD n=1 Tax=Saccharibacillus sp. CPCC 101409 TaxID=3058041 RepID=UPI0026738618|nr:glucose-1-phosphate adenylyltransferase subunit GlgD [Saccharibacillus sp. CPCC 101409]MDO3411097.1 glucose-1-phosphate adenylyltransferase subunit GlgD [Saccharibacillus sp. CPCC 101409]